MLTDSSDVCYEWSQGEEHKDPAENKMDCSRGTLLRESSISFGRFESDSLAWEKWSAFSQNRYLEEVERFSTPGSVIQKKAYFEAHFKKIAARKALEQQAQLEQQGQLEQQAQLEHQAEMEQQAQLESHSGMGSSLPGEDDQYHHEESTNFTYQNGGEDEVHTFVHTMNFDNSPHQTDAEEETGNAFYPNNGMFGGQTEEPSQYLLPVMNNLEQEEYGENISSSKSIIVENDEEHSAPDTQTNVDTTNVMEVDKIVQCEEEPEHRHSPKASQMDNRGIQKEEENDGAANHSLSDSQKQKQTKKPTLKGTATSNAKRAKVPRNQTSISTKSLPNGISRTPKVHGPSRPNNSARGLQKASAKPDNGATVRKKVADEDTMKKKTFTEVDKKASTKQVLGEKKQASKSLLNGSAEAITSKTKASTNEGPKTASLRTPRKEHMKHTKDNLTSTQKQIEKKQADPKRRGDVPHTTSAGSHKSPSASKLDIKASGVGFSFKSDERAEKRKEFYMKLEEKMNAREAEMNEIQAKTQEEKNAEIKQLRKSLNFKATPMPTFYLEAVSTKVEIKKIPPTTKSQKIGRKSTNSGTDSDSSSVPTHRVVPTQGFKNNTNPSKKNWEARPDTSVASSLNKAQKEAGSTNLPTGKPLKSKIPSNDGPRREPVHPARVESPSAQPIFDGLKAKVMENLPATVESNEKGVYNRTSALNSDDVLDGRQEDLMNSGLVLSNEEAKSETNIDKVESEMIANTEVKMAPQNSEDTKEKVVSQKAQGFKDKDNTTSSGSLSKLKPKSPRHALAGTSQDPKDRASKTVKYERQKIAVPAEKGKQESTSNSSVKRSIKGNTGLACLVADVAVA